MDAPSHWSSTSSHNAFKIRRYCTNNNLQASMSTPTPVHHKAASRRLGKHRVDASSSSSTPYQLSHAESPQTSSHCHGATHRNLCARCTAALSKRLGREVNTSRGSRIHIVTVDDVSAHLWVGCYVVQQHVNSRATSTQPFPEV